MTEEYIVVCQSAWMNDSGFGIDYNWDRERFKTMKQAIKHGWKVRGSDDFNTAKVVGDNLVWWGWMDEPMDAAEIPEVAEAIGLKALCAAPTEGPKS
jgi:hypothetical protein